MTLPALPPRCREDMSRVAPRAGEKWRAVQGRWQIVADGVDRRTADCAAFYDDVRSGFPVPSLSLPPSR